MASGVDDNASLEDLLRMGIVSRESSPALELYVELLCRWQKRINLIGENTVPFIWSRHVADSLGLLPYLGSGPVVIVDLGSGAGFPGLVLAIALKTRPGSHVYLIESNGKKAAFLREAVRITQAPASIVEERIESLDSDALRPEPDFITSRALAPLPKLLEHARKWLKNGAVGLFLKGQDVDSELTVTPKYPNIRIEKLPNPHTGTGVILKVQEVSP